MVRVIFQVGKGKKRNFPGGEKRKLLRILPEKNKTRQFTCQKLTRSHRCDYHLRRDMFD